MKQLLPKIFQLTRLRYQRGYSSLGMAFTVLATGVVGVGLSRQAVVTVESSQGRAQGALLDKLNNAVNTYMANNFTQVTNNAVVNIPTGGTIPAGSSLQPTLAQLQGMGVLDVTFQAAALNGGNYQILITRSPASCWLAVPNNCNLQSRVWVDQPFLNAAQNAPSTRLVQAAVAAAPGSVGTSNKETPTVINGPSWSVANPVAGTPAGILMAVGGYASSAFANYLPLRGGAMNGGIDMGAQAITNASSITSNGALVAANLQTSGDASVSGNLSIAAGRSRLWSVPTEGAVLTMNDASGQSMHQNLLNGRMRWINGAYSADLGGVDQAGNLNMAGAVSAGGQISVGPNNRIFGNGSQGSYGATTIGGDKSGWTGVEFRDSAGNYQVNQMTNRGNTGYYDAASGRWLHQVDTSGNFTLDQTQDWNSGRLNPGWAIETWGCNTGQIAKAAYSVADGWAYNGKMLSCVNGIWRAGTNAAYPSGNGWVELGGGLIMQYGYSGWACVSFPRRFPSAVFSINATYVGANHEMGVSGWDPGYFCPQTNGSISNFFWTAIGV